MKDKKRSERKKSNRPVVIGLIGLVVVLGTLVVLFNYQQYSEPIFIEEVLNDDPENYLVKRINIKDGSVHYSWNYTDGFGTREP